MFEPAFGAVREEWAAADAAPAAVTDLVEVVHGIGEIGRPYFEFADGCMYQVVREALDRVPSVKVVHELDTTDLVTLQRSYRKMAMVVLSTLAATVAAASMWGFVPLGSHHHVRVHAARRHVPMRDRRVA